MYSQHLFFLLCKVSDGNLIELYWSPNISDREKCGADPAMDTSVDLSPKKYPFYAILSDNRVICPPSPLASSPVSFSPRAPRTSRNSESENSHVSDHRSEK